ncbi:unnamed protein product [Vitrella brassicaformis CCMP3155]|uniref:B9 domain-containing protein 2 n=1 Tax=Vitrella brassicaformis (strain CCMP3155) TaxID=1169540 RepID=A0A0G4FP76_VITBC|nr:unnamed protein product [Vitrella brassicaformis CCMP3155]|eukprot:CEM16014.1 unnamed protein product [Vitrella brassicaformis CCMP3155]
MSVEAGPHWLPLSRAGEGPVQTQTAYTDVESIHVWNHPVDLHYATTSIAGWPRVRLQIWRLDEFGRVFVVSYGTSSLPTLAGHYEVDVNTWTPLGTFAEELYAHYVGGRPQLTQLEVIDKHAKDRSRLYAASSGTVRISLDVIVRNFEHHGLSSQPRVREAEAAGSALPPIATHTGGGGGEGGRDRDGRPTSARSAVPPR